MELYREYGQIPSDAAPCAVAIGSFDGLHLGHRRKIVEQIGHEGGV